MESCSRPANLNLPSESHLPADLCNLVWENMDVNEFNDDTIETVVSDVNHNIAQTVMTSPPFETYDFGMNHGNMTETSYSFDTSGYSHCSPGMTSPIPYYGYNSHENTYANFDRMNYNGSPNGSLCETSSPESSLNDSYTDNNHNYAVLQSQTWAPEGQYSDDSVELEFTPIDESPRLVTEGYNFCYNNAYRTRQADVLPHFDKVFPPKHQKSSRRGRPVTYLRRKSVTTPGSRCYSSESSDEDERFSTSPPSPSKCKRGAKNVLLWKFLLEELSKPSGNHVQWVDEREGLFRFVDTAEISKQWGLKKNKEDMNFEKLSRGIRHYYREGLMARQDGTRLVYRFNWDLVPKEFRRF